LGYFKHGEEELEDLSFHRDGNKGVKLPYIHSLWEDFKYKLQLETQSEEFILMHMSIVNLVSSQFYFCKYCEYEYESFDALVDC